MDQAFTDSSLENSPLFMAADDFDQDRASQHLIHLAELAVERVPAGAEYVYGCRITVDTDFDREILVLDLQPRALPNWMLNLQHLGECRMNLSVLYRGPGEDEVWRTAGVATLNTVEDLSSDTAATVVLEIDSWAEAPQLKLRLRFVHHPTVGSHQAHLVPPVPGPARRPAAAALNLAAADSISLPEAPTLTPQEEVILKDTWNKLLAFKDLSLEFFLKRLLVLSPDLTDVFGDSVSGLMDHFCGLFDLTVRRLNPHTEHILREAYRADSLVQGQTCRTVEEYGADFARLGMRPRHWLVARDVWSQMIAGIPYIEAYESENLELGENSAFHRFFTGNILRPMLEALIEHEKTLPAAMIQRLACAWAEFADEPHQIGVELFQALFRLHPEAVDHFSGVDIDRLATDLLSDFEAVAQRLASWDNLLPEGRGPGREDDALVTPAVWFEEPMAKVLAARLPETGAEAALAWRALCERLEYAGKRARHQHAQLLDEAHKFLCQMAGEFGWEKDSLKRRLAEVDSEISATGTYTHTYEELAFGARLAWRNASKCVGRLSWKSLMVRDCRHVTHPDEMFENCVDHLRIANNGGKIQPLITIFRPAGPTERWGPRLWNPQLIRYAGYRNADGSILGDPANAGVTEAVLRLGWMPPHNRTPYDILPLVIDVPGKQPSLHEVPKELVLEVELEHPSEPRFKDLGLKWYAVPAISNFRLDIGGVIYSCCPFNGWYLCTEIGRNFTDAGRYNRTEDIARALDLDSSNDQTLWRDDVFVQLNKAVVHSFVKNKVVLVDHHQAGRQFLTHDLREKKAGRECPGQWSWVVPPQGGSICPIYHHEMRDFLLKPEYRYGADRWAVEGSDAEMGFSEDILLDDEMQHDRFADLVVLYASETGTAETLARQTARSLRHYRTRVMPLDAFQVDDPGAPNLMLIVVSTGSQGRIAEGGRWFYGSLARQADGALRNFHYAVMAVGSRGYDNFCAGGEKLDQELSRLGATAMAPIHRCDVLGGLDSSFNSWLSLVTRRLGADPTSSHTDTSLPAVRLEVELAQAVGAEVGTDVGTAGGDDGRVEVPVVELEQIRAAGEGILAAYSLVLDLVGTQLEYQAGDRVLVYPRHPKSLVQRLCRRVGLAPAMGFTARYFGRGGQPLDQASPIPVPTTIHQLFSDELDLGLTQPYTELIAYLYENAQDPVEQRQLESWLTALRAPGQTVRGRATREALRRTYPSVVDLLESLPSVEVHLADLIELLPRQRPRFYTAASAPEQNQKQLRLLFEDAGGLCSSYLAGLSPEVSDGVRMRLVPSSFKLPAALAAPALMVAEDAGISPFLGFLQNREARRQAEGAAGPVWLFAASRGELPGRSELDSRQKGGSLSYLGSAAIAPSDSGAGSVLEKLIEQQEVGVWQMLSHPQGHYYASASSRTLDEVYGVLLRIACRQGGLSYSEAVKFFAGMKAEQRFMTEIRGVLESGTQVGSAVLDSAVLDSAVSDSVVESTAETWLRRFSDQAA